MIDQFLDYMRYERRRSPETVQKYGLILKEFTAYLDSGENGLSWSLVEPDTVRNWVEHLLDKGSKAVTVNLKLSALRSFYRFALRQGAVQQNPASCVVGPKRERPLPQFVKEADMSRMIDDDEKWGDDYVGIRARTLFIILYEAGLRRAELIGLDDSDVDLEAGELKVTGKRNKQRVIPFGEEVRNAVIKYKVKRDETVERENDALFVSDKGKRLTGKQVYCIVRKYLSGETSLKKRSPHVLRHSFATAMLNNGAGLESVRKLLGHESLETTEIYTHTTFEQLRKAYDQAHPRG